MPYVDAPVAMNELKAIAKKDRNAFFKAMDDMYELILDSSEHTGYYPKKIRTVLMEEMSDLYLREDILIWFHSIVFMMNRLRMLRADSYIMIKILLGELPGEGCNVSFNNNYI